MRREMFNRHRRLRPRSWKAMRDERPIWARHYRGRFFRPAWYTKKIKRRTRTRLEKADRHEHWFIALNYGSWKAKETTWPALRW